MPRRQLRFLSPPPSPWHLADWDGYVKDVEAFAKKVPKWKDPHESASKYVSAIKKAAMRHVGMCSTSKKARNGWWTAEVAEVIARRNAECARQRTLTTISAADAVSLLTLKREARAAVRDAKRSGLEKLLANATGNPRPIYDYLRRTDGRERVPLSCPLADENGAAIADAKSKANRLGLHYARVCSTDVDDDDLVADRHPPKQSSAARRPDSALHASERDLSSAELEFSLLCLTLGNSAGPDGIPTTLLLHLGPQARLALLHVFNLSWTTGVVPSAWRRALITPLPKPDKDVTLCPSYRPIALTSNVCKLLERILRARLSQLFDDPAFAPSLRGCQAGFQRLRSTSEQIALFAQGASDSAKAGRHSVALFFDMEKAFDTISKDRLHVKLESLGVPLRFRYWIRNYLDHRVAAVVVEGARGKFYRMDNGVPQGTVLSPLLFICLLDDLATTLDTMPGVLPSLFADDIAVLATGDTLQAAERTAQAVLRAVEASCAATGLRLSKPKTFCMPAGLRSAKAADSTPLDVCFENGALVPTASTHRFLGVLFDPKLSFGSHVAAALNNFRRRLYIIRSLRDRSWGASRHLLRSVFWTFVLPTLTYGLGAFGPFLTQGLLDSINSELAIAGRIISGCPRNAKNESVLWEAHLEDARTLLTRAAAFDMERYLRLPGTSGFTAANGSGKADRSWLSVADQAVSAADLYPKRHKVSRAPLKRYSAVAPWDLGAVTRLLALRPFIDGLSKSLPKSRQLGLASAVISACRDDWVVYSDGSLDSLVGGAGAVLYGGDSDTPTTTTSLQIPRCSSSYRTEMTALELSLDLLLRHAAPRDSATIFSDSQSAIRKLGSGPSAATDTFEFDVWSRIRTLTVDKACSLTIQFVPGHAGIVGNDLADAAAKRGLTCPTAAPPLLSFSCAKCLIRRYVSRRVCPPAPDGSVYDMGDYCLRPPLAVPRLTREGETVLARLRVGRHPLTFDRFERRVALSPPCACGRSRGLYHMLKFCRLTRALRHELLPIADYRVLLCFHGLEVLQFLAAADLLYGSVDLYVTPYPPADAALALVVVAAAAAAASVAPVES